MRRRLRPTGSHPMARRPSDDGRALTLSPRIMRIGGWIVAIAIIAGIAVVVGVLGGDADGAPTGASPSGSGTGGTVPITFGTAIDQATGQIPDDARTDRFTVDDTFAYSAAPPGPLPDPVYVEVRRTGGGAVEIVQAPSGAQGARLGEHAGQPRQLVAAALGIGQGVGRQTQGRGRVP